MFTMQVATDKTAVITIQDAAHSAVKSLQQARQVQPSYTCQTLKQECELYSKLQNLAGSAFTSDQAAQCQHTFKEICT